MLVQDVMKPYSVIIQHDQPYHSVATILESHNAHGAPVVDGNNQLIGIISKKDLFQVLFPYYQSFYTAPEIYTDFERRERKIIEIKSDPITKFMNKKLITTKPKDPVMKIGGIMLAHNIEILPVLDEDNDLIGIIEQADIYKYILKHHLNAE